MSDHLTNVASPFPLLVATNKEAIHRGAVITGVDEGAAAAICSVGPQLVVLAVFKVPFTCDEHTAMKQNICRVAGSFLYLSSTTVKSIHFLAALSLSMCDYFINRTQVCIPKPPATGYGQ
jgi:hypothetical protein